MKKLSVLFLLLIFTSCTDSTRAKLDGYGDEFKVEIINCDGSITHSYISSGRVNSENNSDGYYFKDKQTGKLIKVSGNLIITKQ